VDEARLGAGQRILITGAAGGVGHFAVQIAKPWAPRCRRCGAANADFVRLWAPMKCRPRRAITRRADRSRRRSTCGVSSFTRAAKLSAAGCYLNTGGGRAHRGECIARPVQFRQRAIPIVLDSGSARWERLAALARQGALSPHIERTIGLEDVAEAQRAMETGHGRGKIVVRLR
jgi:NADPH:quinone reductase-like Zn-dependent oxidoreductase